MNDVYFCCAQRKRKDSLFSMSSFHPSSNLIFIFLFSFHLIFIITDQRQQYEQYAFAINSSVNKSERATGSSRAGNYYVHLNCENSFACVLQRIQIAKPLMNVKNATSNKEILLLEKLCLVPMRRYAILLTRILLRESERK